MLLPREFGHNGLIATFAPRQDMSSHRVNVHDLLQELDIGDKGATFEAN
jgi:hypothetical protein